MKTTSRSALATQLLVTARPCSRPVRCCALAAWLFVLIAMGLVSPPAARAYHVRGIGESALIGHDLTDPEDDGDPASNVGYNATFSASEEANFSGTGFDQGAFNVFDNHLGKAGDKWCCGTLNEFPTNPISIDATFPASHVLRRFTLSSADDAPERDPLVWKIQGSNDGVTFTDIYSRSDLKTSVWTARSQVVEFVAGIDYALPPAYTTFRFLCTATGSKAFAPYQLGEIEYLETSASLVVTTTADEDNGSSDPLLGTGTSLREALNYAATLTGPQTIKFSSTAAFGATNFYDGTHTITLGTAELLVAKDVTIAGPGANRLTIQRGAAPDFRIFRVSNATATGPHVTFSGLTIANGKATGGVPDTLGGGIYNDHGVLVVQNCVFVENFAQGDGGAIFNDGASPGAAKLTVSGCTFVQNRGLSGGAILNWGGAGGNGTVEIVNSTFGQQSAGTSGANINNYGLGGTATVTLTNCTFQRGSSDSNSGIRNDGRSGGTATLTIANTILATNVGNANIDNDEGTVVSLGHNIANDAVGGPNTTAPGGLLNAIGDLRNTDPLLDPAGPQDNGGTTPTFKLPPGSPAIDGGDNNLAVDGNGALTADQRGGEFSRIVKGKPASATPLVDIGAYEVQGITFAPGLVTNGLALDAADQPFVLAGPTIGAMPTGGTFSGPGVDAGGLFHPEFLIPGTYVITYTTTTPDDYGNTGSTTFTITVTATAPYVRVVATVGPGGSGIDVPGESAGTKFTQLGLASMDTAELGKNQFAGVVGARVRIRPPAGAEVPAIYQGFATGGLPATGTIVVRGGDSAPDGQGGTRGVFASFQEPAFGGGYYAFGATLTGSGVSKTNDTGLWASLSGQLDRVAGKGATVSGASGTPLPGVFYEQIQSYVLASSGTGPFLSSVTFVARMKGAGVNGSNNLGVWQYRPGLTRLIFRTGDLVPLQGGNGAVKSLKLFIPAKTIPGQRRSYAAGSNTVIAFATFGKGREALLTWFENQFQFGNGVAIENINVGHLGIPSVNAQGNFAMHAGLSIGAAYTQGPGKVSARTDRVILVGSGRFNIGIQSQESSPVAFDSPETFTAFEEPAFNDAFHTAFFASVTRPGLPASQRRVLIYDGLPDRQGAAAIIARTGTPAAGLNGGVQWQDFTTMALPDSAYGPVFLARLSGPGVTPKNNLGLWATDLDGTVRLLLRTGDPVAVNGATKTVSLITTLGAALDSPGQGRYVDRLGNVSATLTCTDGTVALVHFGLPTPAE